MMLPQLVLVGGTAILSSASIFNIYETYSLIKGYPQQLQSSDVVSKRNKWKTTDEAVNGLSNMKKKELIELYLQCEPPDLPSDISYYNDKYQYDGYLLDNGPVLTLVTGFITNRLFGKGKPWLGKVYMTPTSNIGTGKNRFALNSSIQTPQTIDERLDRTFDYSIGKSILPSPSSTNKSLFNKYASRCSSLSPMSLLWKGMVDEIRVIKLATNNKEKVLLGVGYFTWSGGVYNLAPFCLVARKCNIDKVK